MKDPKVKTQESNDGHEESGVKPHDSRFSRQNYFTIHRKRRTRGLDKERRVAEDKERKVAEEKKR